MNKLTIFLSFVLFFLHSVVAAPAVLTPVFGAVPTDTNNQTTATNNSTVGSNSTLVVSTTSSQVPTSSQSLTQVTSSVQTSGSLQNVNAAAPSNSSDSSTRSSSSIPTSSAPSASASSHSAYNLTIPANNSTGLNQTYLSGVNPNNGSQLLLPTNDPFYDAPKDIADYELGQIVRYRKINPPGLFNHLNGNFSAAYQVLFRSSDTFDQPIAGMTTVFVPYNPSVNKLLSYQSIEDSSADRCAPSYTFRDAAHADDFLVAQATWLQSALNRGWVVSIPDYEGPNSAFTAGKQSGHVTLDSLRAILRFGDLTGIKEKPTIALWGYSGGSIGTVKAAELQPSYAPELEIAGAAAGGLTPNLTEIAIRMNKSIHVGITFSALHGLSAEYPKFKKVIEEDLYPDMVDKYMKAKNMCIDDVAYYNYADWTKYFKSGENLLDHPTVKEVMDANAFGKHVPQFPMFWYDGPQDDIGDYDTIKKLYHDFCDAGASIRLHEDLTARHTPLAMLGAKDAMGWLVQVMDGKVSMDGCHHEIYLSNSLTPEAMSVFGQELGDRLAQMMPQPDQEAW